MERCRFFGQLQAVPDMLLHKPCRTERGAFPVAGRAISVAVLANRHNTGGRSCGACRTIFESACKRSGEWRYCGNFLRNQSILIIRQHKSGREIQLSRVVDRRVANSIWRVQLRTARGRQSASADDVASQSATQFYLGLPCIACAASYLCKGIEPDALQLDKPVRWNRLPGFHDGMVSVQDAGAHMQHVCWMFTTDEGTGCRCRSGG